MFLSVYTSRYIVEMRGGFDNRKERRGVENGRARYEQRSGRVATSGEEVEGSIV
jgi:hypothetical protein